MSSSVITAEEALNTILERYLSGASRCERLHYFALHAGNGTEDPTTDTAIRKAYRVLSETCKREGNVVRYKLVFGGQQQQQAGATTSHASGKSSKTSSSNNHRHQQQQQHAPEDASMNMDSGDGSGSDNNNNVHNMSGETTASSQSGGSHHQNHMVWSAAVPSPSGVDTGVVYDSAWVTEQEHAQRSHQQVLEHRLQVALSQLHKESIRAAYLALAAHATNCGDETGRFHALLRAKDYCTHKAQTIQVSLQIVSAALAIHNTVAAQEYIHKLQHTLRANNTTTTTNTASGGGAAAASGSKAAASLSSSSSSTWVDQILVNTAAALERMAHGDFGGALSHWMNVVQHEELETAFNSEQVASLPYWVSVQDVSLYAALCCLTHGRPDQRTALADHVTALEYVPHLKQCLHDFSHAKYADVWQCVAVQCAASLRTDVVVGPHLPHLLSHVLRRKLLQQYWRAYTQVPLTVMAQDLGPALVPSVDALRQEWIDMILEQQQQQPSSSSKKKTDGKSDTAGADADKTTTTTDTSSSSSEAMADTRLNLATDTLHRDEDRTKTQRRQALQLAKLTQHVLNDSYAMTIRLACQEHDLCVVNPLAGTVGGGKAGGARPRGRTRGGMMAMGGGGGGASAGDPILMDDDVVSGNDDADDFVAMESDEAAAAVAAAAAGETEEDDDEEEEDTTMVDASAMNPEDLY